MIRKCTVPGTVALTFDDGPDKYTCDLLDLLDRYDAKATFFITGVNNGKGAIDDPDHPWDKLIVRMRDSNHQIASHTWSHQDLSALSLDQLREQMLKNEAAFRNILGNFPSYMRPPYSRCGPENGCLEEMSSLGYHVILYDIDTADYNHDSPDQIQISKDIFDRHMASSKASENSWLVIAHDVHEQTVHNLTEHMLKSLRANGYRAVTVGECLDDPKDFWYRKDSHAPSDREYRNSTAIIKNISVDGSCGVTANATCTGSQFGHCCSARNFCGNSLDHCGVGCQSEAGRCPMDSTEPHDAGVIPSDDTIFEEPEDHGKKPTKSKSDAYSVSRVGSTVTGLMVVSAVMVLLV